MIVIDTETAIDAGSDAEVDTGENEIPPDLPDACVVELKNHMASTTGDTRSPDIAFGSVPLLTWAHGEQQNNPDWKIEVVAYDPEIEVDTDTGSDVDTDPVGPVSVLDRSGPLSRDSIMTVSGEVFGLAWLEGSFDSNCGPTDWDTCLKELMFLRVDAQGQPIDSPEPIRITNLVVSDSSITARPSITNTPTGYVLVWNERNGTEVRVMARALDASGNFVDGAAHQISSEKGVYPTQQPVSAALGGTVAVVWIASDQQVIMSRTLNATAVPVSDVQIIEEGISCLRADVVAGNDGFMISWSRRPLGDFEVFTTKLLSNGVHTGAINRITWTVSNVMDSVLAWDASQQKYAIAWTSLMANGDSTSLGNPQVFASILDNTGKLASNPVRLSDNPNTCSAVALSWDQGGWTSLWELQGNARKQLVLGRMKCR